MESNPSFLKTVQTKTNASHKIARQKILYYEFLLIIIGLSSRFHRSYADLT